MVAALYTLQSILGARERKKYYGGKKENEGNFEGSFLCRARSVSTGTKVQIDGLID